MRRILAVLAIALAGAASAQEAPIREAQAAPAIPCTCRAQGRVFALGELACLRTPEGGRLAECRMAINVTSWDVTDRACPES